MFLAQRSNYLYHSHYCEENIWHLCQRPELNPRFVIVIAARGDCFPMLCQTAAEDADTPLLWDYHVILLAQADQQSAYIFDFDTTLGFGTPITEYLQRSFLAEKRLIPAYIPWFRLVPADIYVSSLLSDRRHMKTAQGWMAPPPDWPALSDSKSNLHQFTNMADLSYGRVFSHSALLQAVTAGSL